MRLLISIIICFTILAACSTDDVRQNFEVGSEFLNDSIQITSIDTISIKTGTFRVESTVTSGSGRLLIGQFKDSILGETRAQPYFQLNIDPNDVAKLNTISTDVNSVLDSIILTIRHDGYREGDSLKTQTYKVHQLLEEISTENSSNNSSLPFNDISIADIEFIAPDDNILPNETEFSSTIQNNTDFAIDLFEKIQNGEISTVDEFIGLTMVSENENSHILGFEVRLRLHYTEGNVISDTNEDSIDDTFIDFNSEDPITNSTIDSTTGNIYEHFNQITTENIDTSLQSILDDSSITINSEQTNNLTYIQNGTGISTKIEIPTSSLRNLNIITNPENEKTILSATLSFKPSPNSSFALITELPALFVYIVDNENNVINILDDNNNLITINASPIDLNGDFFYSVDLVEYVKIILEAETLLDYSLMVQFTNPSFASLTTLDSFVIDGTEANIDFSLKYLTFE